MDILINDVFNRPFFVNGFTQDIEHAPQGWASDRDFDRFTRVFHGQSPPDTGCGAHGDGSNDIRIHVLFNFKDEGFLLVAMNDQGVVNAGQVPGFESHINNHTDCSDDYTLIPGFE